MKKKKFPSLQSVSSLCEIQVSVGRWDFVQILTGVGLVFLVAANMALF